MERRREIIERLRKWREESHDRHEDFQRLHCEYDKQQRELRRQQWEFEKHFKESYGHNKEAGHEDMNKRYDELRRQRNELERRYRELRKSKLEFHSMHRHVRFSPPIILGMNLVIWYLVFRYAGIREVSIIFAILFSVGGLFESFFLRKLERRIITPIDKLKTGLEEISKGNYNVKVESCVHSEIGLLIEAFNKMAEKLQESEKVKAEYEENRRTLIANISHDLKTPITSIQGYIEAITEDAPMPPDNLNKYLKVIYNNTEYINKLIDDLFLFSKLDMQKLEFKFTNVDVRSFFSDMMEEFKLQYEESDITFEYCDSLKEDCSFNIDGKRLHQVFMNIIGNAVKYGPEQNLSLRTELFRLNDYIYIDIKDNGPGISKDKLSHIFDRFYRIDTERTKDLMSTGLGLAIAKELVEAHGGKISVTSVEGEGSCFTIMLPTIQ